MHQKSQRISHPIRSRSLCRPALPARIIELLEPRVLLTTVPVGFSDGLVATGISSPTAMTVAGDGRIFVAEKGGDLRVIQNDVLLGPAVLSVTVDSAGERGLLGVATDPLFAVNHFIYVYYTATTPVTHNRVSRFTMNGNVAQAGSEVVLLDIDPLSGATNHNGGAIHFGPDGKLYIAVGENADGTNSQSLTTLKGKVLRINADGTIPTDNPFYNVTTGNNRAIWAMGLRNPFTFAFEPKSGGGRMFINDVGQSTWEEIDVGRAGANYGWPGTEGTFDPAAFPAFTNPIYEYGHPPGVDITGGVFYEPAARELPETYVGKYFFADAGAGFIKVFDPVSHVASDFASGAIEPVDLDMTADGGLLYLDLGSGEVHEITYAVSQSGDSDFFGLGGTTHNFVVNFTDDLNVATLRTGALVVTGPNGFSVAARLVSVDTARGRATFQITAPGGTWDAADTGRYVISLAPNVLKDAGNQALATAAGAVTVGDFYYDADVYFRGRWYEMTYPDVAAAVRAGALASSYQHFVQFGAHEGRSPSPFFNERAYRANNPDVAAAVNAGAIASGYVHFVSFGQREGRQANAYFSEREYLAKYADVAAAVRAGAIPSGYYHFVTSGAREGRSPSVFFDAGYYLSANPAIAQAVRAGDVRSAFEDFVTRGIAAGRAPTPYYNEVEYLQLNPDVAAAVSAGALVSGLQHFILYGERAGRRISKWMDMVYYAANSPDAVAAVAVGTYRSLYEHFLRRGLAEKRKISPLYDETYYIAHNPDVAAAVTAGVFVSGFEHFVRFGQFEGRKPAA